MELDKNIEQELAGLLANPEKVSPQHTAMLNDLLQEYPYYQPLHLLLAKANLHAEENNALAKASLYTNGQTLHRFLFEQIDHQEDFHLNEIPFEIGAELQVVTDEQETFEEISEHYPVVQTDNTSVSQSDDTAVAAEESIIAEALLQAEEPSANENVAADAGINTAEADPAVAEESESVVAETSMEAPTDVTSSDHIQLSVADEQETFEEISEPAAFAQFESIPAPTVEDIPAEESVAEENVFEEIGEVDYDAYRPFRNSVAADEVSKQEETSSAFYTVTPKDRNTTESLAYEGSTTESFESSPDAENLADQENSFNAEKSAGSANAEDLKSISEHTTEQADEAEPEIQKNTLEDAFVFESIVSSDFFAFENNFSAVEEVQPEKPAVPAPPVIEEHDEAAAAEVANSRVSNYNDDKLPYTFLWWLAKTRKEHESFQPYVAAKKPGSNELQQQYVEHIFHMQSHLTGNEALLDSTEEPKPVSKDFQIIDSFIKNDPQIHPPNAEQIDNENKAKKSAEDQNDLVSETLAGIYIEQMLYDKAIDTYEKLSLKFPEKSRYFADLIQSIEKKI